MWRSIFKTAIPALLTVVVFGDPSMLWAQARTGFTRGGFGGFSRWDAGPPVATPLPETAPRPRRWTLYFPPDWRHPAIIRPPVKVYLDPPYGVEDPFGRIPYAPRQVAEPVPADPPPEDPAPSRPRAIPKPKVLELNPSTGRLEERPLRPVGPGLETEPDTGPAPPPPDPATAEPSPFRGLQRWDSKG